MNEFWMGFSSGTGANEKQPDQLVKRANGLLVLTFETLWSTLVTKNECIISITNIYNLMINTVCRDFFLPLDCTRFRNHQCKYIEQSFSTILPYYEV
jgi:hypothetical protein